MVLRILAFLAGSRIRPAICGKDRLVLHFACFREQAGRRGKGLFVHAAATPQPGAKSGREPPGRPCVACDGEVVLFLVQKLDSEAETLEFLEQDMERLWNARVDHVLTLDVRLVRFDAAVHVV